MSRFLSHFATGLIGPERAAANGLPA